MEIKDLRTRVDLREQLKAKCVESPQMEVDEDEEDMIRSFQRMKSSGFRRKNPQTQSDPREANRNTKTTEALFPCKYCEYKGNSILQVREHIQTKHDQSSRASSNKSDKDDEFNCMQCDFQGTSPIQLRNHINIKHNKECNQGDINLKCRICAKEFKEKWNLMKHRKNEHMNAVAFCRKYASGTCPYTAISCWWSHSERKSSTDNCECFICGKTFSTTSELMAHRKKEHLNVVRSCPKFREGSCSFQDIFCWFKHATNTAEHEHSSEDIEENEPAAGNKETTQEYDSVFQEAAKKSKPPSAKGSQSQN